MRRPAELPARRPSLPDPPDPTGLAARYRALVVAAVVAVGCYVVWLSVDVGSAAQRRTVSDLVFVIAPLLAGASAVDAHRRRRLRHTGWVWIAAGCFTWSAASIVWSVYEIGLGDVAPFPSFADIGYVLYVVPIVIGLLRFPNAQGNLWSRLRLILDAVVMSGCLLLASALWVWGPVLHANSGWFVRADALAYPLADVVVATAVLARSMVFARSRRLVWMTLSGGLLVEALVDSMYVAKTAAGAYSPGHLLDAGWLLSFTLIALAAQTPPARTTGTAQRRDIEAPTLLQQLVPYATIGVAAMSVLTHQSQFQAYDDYFWITAALGAVVGLRQCAVAADQVALTRDLSDAVHRRTVELQTREQWWRDLVQNLSDVVMVIDSQLVVQYCSPSVRTTLGHWPRHLRTNIGLRTQVHPDDLPLVLAEITPVLTGQRARGATEARIQRADGSYGWFELTAVGQLDTQALEGAVLTLHDVTERHELTDRLSHQAYHDALTGLPNRALLMKRLEDTLAHHQHDFALVLIDLDDFKLINDSHGHAAGDTVLQALGRRLASAVRSEDTIARLGGDEFAVLVNGTAEIARRAAQRIAQTIAEPVVVDNRRFIVSSSIGVVVAGSDPDESAHALLSHADIALYQAKARDKGGVVIVHGDERREAARQVHLREQIAQPRLEQFSVVYQPVISLVDGRVRGCEALLRWQHPEFGSISPADFIPLAEHGGSITVLGWHVLETACAQLAKWNQQFPDRRLTIGVNVSVLQLDEPRFAERVLELTAALGLAPEQLVLELTEEALARDFETAVAVVAELRAGGVSVAVDDYGTGYSSLRYLHRFAADVVKIDRSFVATLPDSAHTQKIVRSVVDMARSLELWCVAEGIETVEQLDLLRELGCALGQGYLFSRPVPPAQIPRLISSGFSVLDAAATLPRPRREGVNA